MRRKSTTPLESVAKQFEHWRSTRVKRGRIPNTLWALVAPLMNQYCHNKIATTLRVNHGQLKEHALPLIQKQLKHATFLECPLPIASPSTGSCVVEFTCKNGSTVKISGLLPEKMQPLIAQLMGV